MTELNKNQFSNKNTLLNITREHLEPKEHSPWLNAYDLTLGKRKAHEILMFNKVLKGNNKLSVGKALNQDSNNSFKTKSLCLKQKEAKLF